MTGGERFNEDELVARLLAAAERAGASTGGGACLVGPGDDAAVLAPPPGHDLVWTVDDQVEGAHFDLAWADLADVGRKAVGASLSDLAAMGATPLGALVAIHLPRGSLRRVDELAAGLGAKLAACGCPLAGGNLARGERLALSVSALGAVPSGRALLRSTARPGDVLYVTGPLGLARAGLRWLAGGGDRHDVRAREAVARLLDPSPRLAAGRALAAAGGRVACMDLSDGLARDLPRLAKASRVRAVLSPGALPRPSAALADLVGAPALELAFLGGEDYELLVAAPPDLALPAGLTAIGALEAGAPGEVVLPPELAPLAARGFDHFGSQS